MKAVLLVVLALASVAMAVDWAVIVAGSNGYWNYRHQADACHAYQIVSKNGIPAERIVMMYYDDIANDPSNPYPGQLFNKPTAAGTPGVDVYKGCQKDYTGNDVTAANFVSVITGDSAAVKGKKVLKSGPNDNVFIFFTDHGGTGIVAFPVGPYLTVQALNAGLRKMNVNKMYSRLVFYMEACESGSMFENVLSTNLNIYVTTASNAVESSWGCYCPPEDIINGKSLGSCLGDLYSVNWMEDSDKQYPLMKETLQAQFVAVRTATTQSHVMQYGDLTWASNTTIGAFQGEGKAAINELIGAVRQPANTEASKSTVNSRDIKMHTLYYNYLRADKTDLAASHVAAAALSEEITHRVKADKIFSQVTQKMTNSENWGALFTMPAATPIVHSDCVEATINAYQQFCGAFSDYSIQYTRVIYNMCAHNAHSNDAATRMSASFQQMCA